MLRAYSRYTQGSFMTGPRGPYRGDGEQKRGWLHTRQISCLLYYLSAPSRIFWKRQNPMQEMGEGGQRQNLALVPLQNSPPAACSGIITLFPKSGDRDLMNAKAISFLFSMCPRSSLRGEDLGLWGKKKWRACYSLTPTAHSCSWAQLWLRILEPLLRLPEIPPGSVY